ncbi:MAG: hypothetical protein NTV62_04115 [Candidatus Gribaldobacteria bacterium]|nr:hypothetical protein [Candidatus Gribaldobacteria bacterium]
MNFSFQNKTREKIDVILKQARYQFMGKDARTKQLIFIRTINQKPYPRFHLFTNSNNNVQIQATLHMDQVKPTFEGTTAHNADYDGALVEAEATRIQKFLHDEKFTESPEKDF